MLLFRNKSLPNNKELRNSLKSFWGIGFWKSSIICARLGISYPSFSPNLNLYYYQLIIYTMKHKVISKSRGVKLILDRIRILKDLKTYRGLCHIQHLPVHGQRTRTNAQTRKRQRMKNRKRK